MFEENQEVQDPNFGLGQVITKFISDSVSVLFDSQLGSYYPVEVIYDEKGKIKQILSNGENIDVDKLYKEPSLTATGVTRHPLEIYRKRYCIFKVNSVAITDVLSKIENGKYYGLSGTIYDEIIRPLEYGDLRFLM
jgi:hypothetical protein|nr:MAG TPA: hypothetical protein [Caudoviricetes sp.]